MKRTFGLNHRIRSHLAITCHHLRKKALQDLSIEDLRILISQQIGLSYLIPLTIPILEENILAEGDLYAGDLLESVLKSDETFWKHHQQEWEKVNRLYLWQ